MKLHSPVATGFLILGIILLTQSGDPMSADEIQKAFVGNTVLNETADGTSYDFVRPDGTHIGLHPVHGKLTGTWQVNEDGEVCVTWNYPNGAITNCATVVDKEESDYEWGDQELTVEAGDVKNLGG